MGGAMAGIDSRYTAVYYNPAGMSLRENGSPCVGLSYVFNNPDLTLNRNGTKINRVEQDEGVAFGLSTALGGGKISRRIFLGFGSFLPYPFNKSVMEIRSFDPAEPYFIQYENRNRGLFFTAAISFLAYENISLAIGTEVLVRLNLTQANIIMNDEGLKLGFDAIFPLDFAPTFGIAIRPRPWLRFGAAYHGETKIKSEIDISLSVIILDEYLFPVRASFADAYRPQQIDLGFGIGPFRGLLLASALTWVDFSNYIPPVVVFEEMGGSFPSEKYSFRDYWIPRIGAEYSIVPFLAVRAGYFYRNSSVPPQTGETSFIDCPTHGIGTGLGISATDLFDIVPNPIQVEISYQAHILKEVHADKPGTEDDFQASGCSHFFNATLIYNF